VCSGYDLCHPRQHNNDDNNDDDDDDDDDEREAVVVVACTDFTGSGARPVRGADISRGRSE